MDGPSSAGMPLRDGRTTQTDVTGIASGPGPLPEPEEPVGLAAFAGALAGEWDTVEEDMAEIVAARRHH
jgi:hypothetical protein